MISIIFLFSSLLASILSVELDCQSSFHSSCESCIDFSCFWCQGESNSQSFCTSNPTLCGSGWLYEDSLFCPKTEPSFETLEWWGENAFFSRQVGCTSFNTGCLSCVPQPASSGLKCGWCSSQSACFDLGDSNCFNAKDCGCVRIAQSSSATTPGNAVRINVDPLFAACGATNTSTAATSTTMTVSVTGTPSNCASSSILSLSLNPDTVTFTPPSTFSGVCDFEIAATQIQYNTKLISKWTVSVSGLSPYKVAAAEANFALIFNSLKSASPVTVDLCQLFKDDDSSSFQVVTDQGTGYVAGTFDPVGPNTTCACGLGASCPWKFVPQGSAGSGTLKLMVTDPTGLPSPEVVFTTVVANNPPVCTAPSPVTISENGVGGVLFFQYPMNCSDPDGNSLTWSIQSSNLNALIQPNTATITQNGVVEFTLNGVSYGQAVSTITVSDSLQAKSTFTFDVTITFVNDPIDKSRLNLPSSNLWQSFTSPQSLTQTQTFDLTTSIRDEESSFAADSLKCTASPPSSNSVTVGGQTVKYTDVSIVKGVGTIQFLRITLGPIEWNVTCVDDPPSGTIWFLIQVEVTLGTNQLPVIKKAFNLLDTFYATNPTIYKVTDYFDDPDLARGQTLQWGNLPTMPTGFTINSIDPTLLSIGFTSPQVTNLTIKLQANDTIASVDQDLNIYVYSKPSCKSYSTVASTSGSKTVIPFSLLCNASDILSYNFSSLIGTEVPYVTVSLSTTDITFTNTSDCFQGFLTHQVYLQVQDQHGSKSTVDVQVVYTASDGHIITKNRLIQIFSPSNTTLDPGYDFGIPWNFTSGVFYYNLQSITNPLVTTSCGNVSSSSVPVYTFTSGPCDGSWYTPATTAAVPSIGFDSGSPYFVQITARQKPALQVLKWKLGCSFTVQVVNYPTSSFFLEFDKNWGV